MHPATAAAGLHGLGCTGWAGSARVGELDEDHKLLLATAFPLLKSRNSGVVLAVASLFHYVGARTQLEMEAVGRALVRTMRNHRGIQYVILNNIASLAATSPDTFRKYLKDFYAVVRACKRARAWCGGWCDGQDCWLYVC